MSSTAIPGITFSYKFFGRQPIESPSENGSATAECPKKDIFCLEGNSIKNNFAKSFPNHTIKNCDPQWDKNRAIIGIKSDRLKELKSVNNSIFQDPNFSVRWFTAKDSLSKKIIAICLRSNWKSEPTVKPDLLQKFYQTNQVALVIFVGFSKLFPESLDLSKNSDKKDFVIAYSPDDKPTVTMDQLGENFTISVGEITQPQIASDMTLPSAIKTASTARQEDGAPISRCKQRT